LLFTVGTSVTTGASNTTVWAGIHHKTSMSGGSSSFGFPDKTYFTRVQEELASKGVIEDSMDESPETVASRFLKTGTYNDNGSNITNNAPSRTNNIKPSVKVTNQPKKPVNSNIGKKKK
jgi:hypothetical protein